MRFDEINEDKDQRKQNALWAQITAHEKAAKKSKDIKRDHHLKMADQLRSQLKTIDEGFDYTAKDLGNDYAGFPSNHSMKHKFLAKIKPEKQQLYKDKMNNTHNWDSLFALFKVAKARGDIIDQGVAEGEVVAFPKKHRGDISNMHTCPKCGGDTQGGKYQGHEVQVCMPCKQVYLPPNSGIDQQGNKIENEDISRRGLLKGAGAAALGGAVGNADAVAMRMQGSSKSEKEKAAADKAREEEEKRKYQEIVQKYVKIISSGQPLPPKMQHSYDTMKDFRKDVDTALANIPGQPGRVDYEQRKNYHLMQKESVDQQGSKIKEQGVAEEKVRLDPKCWTGKKIGEPNTKVKGGVRVNNCVPKEGVAEEYNTELNEEFDLIESSINQIADHNGVDPEMIWEDLESLSHDELYVFAVTSQLNEDWSKANKSDRTDGMSPKAVKAYRREHPGSKLQTAVTTKPSKLKKGSKASKRRKSYCSRSKGQMNMHNISCAKTPDKAICKARRRWNC